MGVRFYDHDAEANHAAVEARWARIREMRSQPQAASQAQSASAIRANYPHMRPGEIMPLAVAGVPPDDPVVGQVATASAKMRKRRTGLWGSIRDVAFTPLRLGASAMGELGDAASFIAKPVARYGTAAAMAPLEAAQAGLRQVATGLPGQSGEIAASSITGAAIGSIVPFVGTAIGAGVGAGLGAAAGLFAPEVKGHGGNPLMQTTLGQHLIGGASIGTGYLAAGEAHQRQAKAAQAAASINGHALTPGRLIVPRVFEPGSTPYNLLSGLVDASIAMSRLDPTAAALKGVTKYRKGLTSFEMMGEKLSAGAVDGARRDWNHVAAGEWLSGRKGSAVKEWLAKETDFGRIRGQLKGVDVGTVSRLTDATSPQEIDDILRPMLGKELLTAPKVGDPRLGYSISRRWQDSRLAQQLPGGRLDFNDANQATDEFDRLLANIRVGVDERSTLTKTLADHITSGNKREARRLVFDNTLMRGAMRDADPNLTRRWVNRMWAQDREQARYFLESDVFQTAPHGAFIGGKEQGLALSGLFVDHMEDVFALDKATIRDMRQAASPFNKLLASGQWDAVTAVGDAVMSKWRPLVLLRGAWTVRIIGEEQLRMAGAGLNSAFNHPLSYLAMAISDDGTIANALGRIPGGENIVARLGRAKGGLAEEFIEQEGELRGVVNEYTDAMGRTQQRRGWLDTDSRRGRFTRNQTAQTYRRYPDGTYDDGFDEALAERIELLNRDPVAQRVAHGRPFDDDLAPIGAAGPLAPAPGGVPTGPAQVARQASLPGMEEAGPLSLYNWFENGSGAPLRNKLLTEPGGQVLGTRAGVEDFFANTQREVQKIASGDAVLHTAIVEGHIDDVPIRLPNGKLNPEFKAKLRSHLDAGGAAPESVLGDGFKRSDMRSRYDKATDWLFDNFMGKPSAKFSRSVTFRQTYWKSVEARMGSATAADQSRILAEAEKWKLPDDQMARLRSKAAKGAGDMTLEEIDLLSKKEGLNFTRQLLYDSAERGQLSDILRLVFPFAEAQKEVMTRWARLGTENPTVLRRASQVVDGARGAGFFYKDPMTNEEMFAYPGSELITEKMLGVPVKLGGQVKGLSIFGSGVMPGVGPAIQLPARWLLSDKPEYDGIRDMIDPMGQLQGEAEAGPEESLFGAFIPAWARKVWTGVQKPEDDRIFANAVSDIWRSGISSGHYFSETPTDIAEGLEDARHKAGRLFLIRGMASLGGSPAAITPEYMAKDSSGRWHIADILRQDYRTMMEADADTANESFLEKYGDNAFAYMQSYTYTLTAAPNSPEASAWVRANPEMAKKYPETYGYFAPQGEGFDYQSYLRQIREGERIPLSPDEFAAQAQNRVGQMIFYNLKDRFGPRPTKPQREFLTQSRTLIRTALPGFDKHLPLPEKYDAREQIDNLQKTIDDPTLEGNDVADGLRLYFQLRDVVIARAKAQGHVDHRQALDVAHLRAALRQFGAQIAERVPDFQLVFDRVLDREMREDESGGQEAQALAAV
jgi:hypothetical protein